jgi:PAS domain S-box-containing protein
MALLEEMMTDLSFALDNYDRDQARQRAEQALESSERRYRTLIEQAADGIFLAGADHRYIDMNEAGLRMFGARREDIIGTAITDTIDSRDLARLPPQFDRMRREGSVITERLLRRADGTTFFAEINGRILSDGTVLGILRDITERKRMQTELIELNASLEERVSERTAQVAERTITLQKMNEDLQAAMHQLIESEKLAALGSIVAGFAHELNTPLGNVLMSVSTLQDSVHELAAQFEAGTLRKSTLAEFVSSSRAACAIILRGVERSARLVGQFKGVAVDQSSNRRMHFDLLQTIEGVIESLKPSLKHAQVRIEILIDPGIELDSFPGALEQVIINIVMNATTHAFPDGGPAKITLSGWVPGDGSVRLSIADDGCGMSDEVAARAFEPFFTTKLGQGGSGLGLYIVHNLVSGLLGGTVELSTTPGKGSNFLFNIPLVAPDRDAKPES